MRAHQCSTAIVGEGATHRRTGWRHRITVGGYQVKVVALPGPRDPGLHTAPEQYALVRRLAATAGIERRPVKHDAVLAGMQHDGVPLSQRLIGQLETVRTPVTFR